MIKVDVAVQSYKKPESLIYSLLCLHRVSKDQVDQVWINDDQSGPGVLDIYNSDILASALYPWVINVRVNRRRMGWWLSFVKGYSPSYLSLGRKLLRMTWNFYKNKTLFVAKDDIRYQWALNNTNKSYLFVMHDDITFKSNVIKKYIDVILGLSNPGIVGELGQCWRCAYEKLGCSPNKILDGFRPHQNWPMTRLKQGDHKWACRINEWSALISVNAAKFIEDKYSIFFGNFDDDGDVAAYWFSRMIAEGFNFDDPLADVDKDAHFIHWENGRTGHSVWVDQGLGRTTYTPNNIREKLKEDFGFIWSWD